MNVFNFVMAGLLGSLTGCLLFAGGGVLLLAWNQRRSRRETKHNVEQL